MNQKRTERKLERGRKLGKVPECQVCGIEGTAENEHSVCEWSMLRTHHWKWVKKEMGA